jgi:hypothetical protein
MNFLENHWKNWESLFSSVEDDSPRSEEIRTFVRVFAERIESDFQHLLPEAQLCDQTGTHLAVSHPSRASRAQLGWKLVKRRGP